jgi:calcium-dependent protein kinase
VSSEAKVMITKMVNKDPTKRYSADQALQDPWIVKYSQKNNIDLPALTKALTNMKSFRVT